MIAGVFWGWVFVLDNGRPFGMSRLVSLNYQYVQFFAGMKSEEVGASKSTDSLRPRFTDTLDNGMGIGTKDVSDVEELHHIQAPLALLDLGDEGLMPAEPLCDLLLRQVRRFSSSDQFAQ